ncbi:MAG: alpha/beta hydrolase [Bryobacterales bacterium]|nr:alpha/beta hydrolase [Bryobacterales bacterium]
MRSVMWTTMPLLLLTAFAFAAEPEPIPLWPDRTPAGEAVEESVRVTPAGERVVSDVHRPSITPYLPPKGEAAAVIISPGGGHRELWMDHEGHNAARWLSERGVAAFVLRYRLARGQGSSYAIEGHALADMQQAIRVVRERAASLGVDPARVGVMGFSAGGELAALASVRYDAETKPAFQALVYPAIPRDMTLPKDTPPAFLVCGEDDRQNISQGLPELYLALKRAGASAELHVYARTGHGFGVRARNRTPAGAWLARFHEWLGARDLLGR